MGDRPAVPSPRGESNIHAPEAAARTWMLSGHAAPGIVVDSMSAGWPEWSAGVGSVMSTHFGPGRAHVDRSRGCAGVRSGIDRNGAGRIESGRVQ